MYSIYQVIRGLRNPKTIVREIRRQWRTDLRPILPHDVAIRGSYRTGNVGNRAVGEILRHRLSAGGNRVKLFTSGTERPRAPVRMIGGGGGFHDRWGPDRIRSRLEFVSNCRGAIVATGVPGIRTEEGRQLVDEQLPEVDIVTIRSRPDLEKLAPNEECNAHVTACPTLLYADPEVEPNGRTGVNFLPWFFDKSENEQYDTYFGDSQHLADYFGYDPDIVPENAKEAYILNARRICDRVSDPIFIPFAEDDERFAREYLDVEIQPYTFSVAETFRRISAVDRMVCTRFHCLVFAAVCRKPILALAYAPKVTSLADRLNISSFKLHHDIPVQFESVSGLDALRRSAMENFELLDEHVFRTASTPTYSISRSNLTEPRSVGH
jgi:hypothetical protein